MPLLTLPELLDVLPVVVLPPVPVLLVAPIPELLAVVAVLLIAPPVPVVASIVLCNDEHDDAMTIGRRTEAGITHGRMRPKSIVDIARCYTDGPRASRSGVTRAAGQMHPDPSCLRISRTSPADGLR
jgi:hypothetical protein